jgi:hypothetical protein
MTWMRKAFNAATDSMTYHLASLLLVIVKYTKTDTLTLTMEKHSVVTKMQMHAYLRQLVIRNEH